MSNSCARRRLVYCYAAIVLLAPGSCFTVAATDHLDQIRLRGELRWGADAEDLSCIIEIRKWDGRS